ncbi:MAG: CapA family protein [Deltaproteobacteria bacterium]|nr:CapA family protein [Deltaproteobacteria bacterium]
MEYRSTASVLLLLSVIALDLSGCKKKEVPKNLPVHTIVYGGDITLARRLNESLHDKATHASIFAEVKPIFQSADIMLGNAEGVVAEGGQFTDKGEPRPYMYRAHPIVMDILKDAGFDVLTVGNNHSGDYGPEAFSEMLDRLTAAGIGYTGGGHNLADAARPFYRKVDDTVVAIVGGDLTMTHRVRALKNRAGPLFSDFFFFSKLSQSDKLLSQLSKTLKEARKHAHVVLFSPHWGENWKAQPSKVMRALARRIIELGYDGIIGHSSHWYHGVELIDGKPVIYDAGNLLLDYGGGDPAHRAFLWELSFNRAGVTAIKGYPLWLEFNQTTLAKGKIQKELLKGVQKRSKDLGTTLTIDDGVVTARCKPGEISGPGKAAPPPARAVPGRIRMAPSDTVIDVLPKRAIPVNIAYEEGIRLIGYELLSPELAVPKAGQFVILYWTTDQEVKKSYTVHLEAHGRHFKTGKKRKEFAIHLPGDWLLPTNKWPVGKVIRDWTLFRLTFKPEGKVTFYMGLRDKGLLTPKSEELQFENNKLFQLGQAVYRKGAPQMFKVVETYRKKHGKYGGPRS